MQIHMSLLSVLHFAEPDLWLLSVYHCYSRYLPSCRYLLSRLFRFHHSHLTLFLFLSLDGIHILNLLFVPNMLSPLMHSLMYHWHDMSLHIEAVYMYFLRLLLRQILSLLLLSELYLSLMEDPAQILLAMLPSLVLDLLHPCLHHLQVYLHHSISSRLSPDLSIPIDLHSMLPMELQVL